MSADEPGEREVAHRLFAAEYDESTLEYSESDEERAPNYLITPTGARVNRLFVVGVLTEVERVTEETLRGRIADPTGAFVVYAGQYQPDAATALERLDPPAFVAVTGKANAFTPDGSDRVLTSIRPESINEVDADTRDRYTVSAAEHTLKRVAAAAGAVDTAERGDPLEATLRDRGVRPELAAGLRLALDHYGTTLGYLDQLRRTALDAARLVAGEVDEVTPPSLAPDETGVGRVVVADLVDAAPGDTTDGTESAADTAGTPTPGTDVGGGATGDDGATASEPETSEAAASASDTPASDTGTGTETGTATGPSGDTPESPTPGDIGGDPDSSIETPAPATDEGALNSDDGDASRPDPESTHFSETERESDSGTGSPETSSSGGTSGGGTLGDFEPSGGLDGADSATDTGEAPVTDEMYELDDEERERVEEEFGTDFSTGTEVDAPGQADIETPEPDDDTTAADAGGADPVEDAGTTDEVAATDDADTVGDTSESPEVTETDHTSTSTDTDADATAADAAGDSAADGHLDTLVVEYMDDLDDGDGADRESVVAAVVDDTGASPDAVDDAIQEALMSGQCYEPGEGTLKTI